MTAPNKYNSLSQFGSNIVCGPIHIANSINGIIQAINHNLLFTTTIIPHITDLVKQRSFYER
jgi:hypothetical protein